MHSSSKVTLQPSAEGYGCCLKAVQIFSSLNRLLKWYAVNNPATLVLLGEIYVIYKGMNTHICTILQLNSFVTCVTTIKEEVMNRRVCEGIGGVRGGNDTNTIRWFE